MSTVAPTLAPASRSPTSGSRVSWSPTRPVTRLRFPGPPWRNPGSGGGLRTQGSRPQDHRGGTAGVRGEGGAQLHERPRAGRAFRDVGHALSLIHISEPTRQAEISYAVFCLKKKK